MLNNGRISTNVPLIDVQSAEFVSSTNLASGGACMVTSKAGGLFPPATSSPTTTLRRIGLLRHEQPLPSVSPRFLFRHVHGGILSPQTRQLRPDATTLARLDHRDTKRGHRAGREFYFVDAEPHEQRYTEYRLIDRLRESVTEMASWSDGERTWFFAVGCLPEERSGQCFPMTPAEQRVYLPQRQRLELARKQHKATQRSAMLQGV
jgi:hypothetical protein